MTQTRNALAKRRAALEELGFTVVEFLPDGFMAMRRKWHWDVFSRLTTLVRVRTTATLGRADMLPGQRELTAAFRRHDTGKIPRAFQHGWVLIDAWIAETVDSDAVLYAMKTVQKGLALTWHPVILHDSEPSYQNSAMYGRAYWPKTNQCIRAAALAEAGPESSSALGTLAGIIIAANALIVSLMCCGIPLFGWLGIAALESEIQPAIED